MPRESSAKRKQRTARIIAALEKAYPDATCALNHSSPLQLLVATILSAHCSDRQVNLVTKGLFGKYRTAADYAGADPAEFQEDIRSIGLFRNKTRSILGAATAIVEEFDGEVPKTMADLLTLPGVARKTANVVLGNAFGVSEGVVVDTHVFRLANRLKLTAWSKVGQSHKVEQDLMALVPRGQWTMFAHWMIFHGRSVCTARKPDCQSCVIQGLCPSAFKA
ncbi:MAG: endonuclease III [Phycisphaerae bacterium]